MSETPKLLALVRKACPSALWSKGVELLREGAVVAGDVQPDEVEFRVTEAGGLRTWEVSLFPAERDWSCSCPGRFDACEHVAAAAIARSQGGSPVGAGAQVPGHIAYRFRRAGSRLWLARRIVHGDQEAPLPASLAAMARGQGRGPRFAASQADLRAEVAGGAMTDGVIPAAVMSGVLEALRDAEDVTLDGRPLAVGKATTGMRVRVCDRGDGVDVKIVQDRSVEEIFDNGAVVQNGELRALAPHHLEARTFETYRQGKVFGPEELGTVAGDVLPRLRRRLPVSVKTDRLPSVRTARPQIQLATGRDGGELSVLPAIVYGDPPVARLDGERLTRIAPGDMPIRNRKLERALVSRLEHRLGMEVGRRRCMATGEAVAWVAALEIDDPALQIQGQAHEDFYVAGELEPGVRMHGEADFELTFRTGEKSARSQAVVEAFEGGSDLVPLLGGGFGRVPAAWLSQHGHRVAALLEARAAAGEGEGGAVAWIGDLTAVCEAVGAPPPPAFERLRPLIEEVEALPDPDLPADLTATLRDYQRLGVRWLDFHRRAGLGALLADDMGLGKTLQSLCVIEGRTLVVAPTSVVANWRAELSRFRPRLCVNVYHGPARKLDPDADVTLTTYALLRIDGDTLAATDWDAVVLDEAQAIKNPQSQVARVAHRLRAGFRVALTGTPVENSLRDLWSQMQFLQPGLLGSRQSFRARHGAGDAEQLEALRTRIRPFVLRRRKSEVASELPPRTDVVLRCELSPEERATYDAVLAATREDVARRISGGAGAIQVLEALLRLRQAACHPGLLPGGTEADGGSSKLDLLVQTLEQVVAEGHRALVFSQWTSLLDRVEPLLAGCAMDFVRLDGSTRDRGAVVEAFQDPGGPPVMLVSLRAGGTGLNLTAADHVFLLDPWWNPAVEDQAADRAHRIGQDRPVLVHRLVAADTVEERILALQDRKRAVAEGVVGEGSGGLSREDLLQLIG